MSPEILSQLTVPAVIGLSGLALAGGAGVARISSPLSCAWPAKGRTLLQRLKSVKSYRAPGAARLAAGAAVLSALLVGGGLAAYGAAPAAVPDSLPSQVAGVIGSGDKLSLRLTGSDGARTVAVGETIADGWILSGLTPTKATVSKDGKSREVGLNPSGAVASDAQQTRSLVDVRGAPTIDQVTGSLLGTFNDPKTNATDKILAMTQVNAARIASGASVGGLNQDDTRRFTEMSDKIEAQRLAIRKGEAPAMPFFSEDLLRPGLEMINSVLGPDAAQYIDYLDRIDDNSSIGSQRPDRANNPVTGPSTYYLAAGANRTATLAEAGVDPRGTWVASPPDATGGQTYTRVSDFNGAQQGRNMAQAQAALNEAAALAKGADPAQFGLTPAGAAQILGTLPASVRAAAGR